MPEPHLVDRQPLLYVGVRARVTMATLAGLADRLPRLFAELAASGVEASGAPLFRYLEVGPGDALLVEAGVPVAGEPDPSRLPRDASVATLGGGRFAALTHVGPYDGLAEATDRLLRWGDEQALRWDREIAGDSRRWGGRVESYESDPRTTPPEAWVTEVLIRLVD